MNPLSFVFMSVTPKICANILDIFGNSLCRYTKQISSSLRYNLFSKAVLGLVLVNMEIVKLITWASNNNTNRVTNDVT